MAKFQQIGGSFAPPLTDTLIGTVYPQLIATVDPKSRLYDALQKVLECCKAWWVEPDSNTAGKLHPSGKGTIVGLDAETMNRLEPVIPWMDELDAMSTIFDEIDPVSHKDLRNAAFHLLWHAKELCLDREPITKDLI